MTNIDVQKAAETVATRIADMLRDLPDPAIPIPRSEWTVGDAAAHLAFTNLGMAMMARGIEIPYGDGTREGLADANEVALEGFSERDPGVLARRIVEGVHLVFAEAAAQPPDRVCSTPMGPMGVDGLTSYLLVHEAMHGSAIATALGAPWPFDAGHIEPMWPFLAQVVPRVFVRGAAAGLTACFELAFGESFSFAMMFDDGRLGVARTPSRPVDCRLHADAQTLFLVLVKIITTGEAVERGDLAFSGPRSELGTTLVDLFNIP